MRKCFGVNPRNGRNVGERHSWPSLWGVGACRYCGRTLDELKTAPRSILEVKPAQEKEETKHDDR